MGPAISQLTEGFKRACEARPDQLVEDVFQSGGAPIISRIAGLEVAAILRRSLAPGGACAAHREAGLRLELWDGESTGVDFDPPPESGADYWRDGAAGERLALSPEGRYVRFSGPNFDIRMDRGTQHAVGWLRSHRLLSSWHRARPLQTLLLTWIASRGLTAVHAAMVARADRGVLLAGPTRRGKSTVAAACGAASFDLLGDDVIALELSEAAVIGHCVHAAVKLRREGIERHPGLNGLTASCGEPWVDERVAFIGHVFPGQVASAAGLAAIAFPMLDESVDTTFEPMGAGEATRELTGCMLSVEPGNVAAAFAAVSEVVERVPAYRLRVGSATDRVAGGVSALLSGLVPAPSA